MPICNSAILADECNRYLSEARALTGFTVTLAVAPCQACPACLPAAGIPALLDRQLEELLALSQLVFLVPLHGT